VVHTAVQEFRCMHPACTVGRVCVYCAPLASMCIHHSEKPDAMVQCRVSPLQSRSIRCGLRFYTGRTPYTKCTNQSCSCVFHCSPA
jgi:hypothetical protein